MPGENPALSNKRTLMPGENPTVPDKSTLNTPAPVKKKIIIKHMLCLNVKQNFQLSRETQYEHGVLFIFLIFFLQIIREKRLETIPIAEPKAQTLSSPSDLDPVHRALYLRNKILSQMKHMIQMVNKFINCRSTANIILYQDKKKNEHCVTLTKKSLNHFSGRKT